MEVGILTVEQKDLLVGQFVQSPYWYFNPILDGNTPQNWVISTEEMYSCNNPDLMWVSELPIIEYRKPWTPSGESYFDQFFLKK